MKQNATPTDFYKSSQFIFQLSNSITLVLVIKVTISKYIFKNQKY